MYFPLLKPRSWGKRSAAQPRAIWSGLPKETLRLCVFTFVTFYGKIRDTYPYAGRKPQNSAALHERNLMEYVPRLHPGDY